jgi:hypothetical protein
MAGVRKSAARWQNQNAGRVHSAEAWWHRHRSASSQQRTAPRFAGRIARGATRSTTLRRACSVMSRSGFSRRNVVAFPAWAAHPRTARQRCRPSTLDRRRRRAARLFDLLPRNKGTSSRLPRARRAFPGAKFIHLWRHSKSTGESLWKSGLVAREGSEPRSEYSGNAPMGGRMAAVSARRLATFRRLGTTLLPALDFALDYSTDPPMIDFQKTW